MQELDGFLEEHRDRFLQELCELLRIPSVSTDSRHAEDVRSAAVWVAKQLEGLSLSTEVIETEGHPIVYAESPPVEGAPTVLVYGHYDVQPVDPLELWETAPFEPVVKDGPDGTKRIVARGSADDKGQLMTFIEACRAYKAETGGLPCKVTIFLEGEEESGSPSLTPFLDANRDELSADVALVCDTNMWDRETPAISTGLRGLVGEEIVLTAANQDLHSGYFGGAAQNPIRVLARILADIHDADGRVTGFPAVERALRSWSRACCKRSPRGTTGLGRTSTCGLGSVAMRRDPVGAGAPRCAG